MRTIGAYEAKTHLPRLLDEVAKGERITITKHGQPVAVLIPPAGVETPEAEALIDRFRMFRRQHPLRDVTIRDLIEDGRR